MVIGSGDETNVVAVEAETRTAAEVGVVVVSPPPAAADVLLDTGGDAGGGRGNGTDDGGRCLARTFVTNPSRARRPYWCRLLDGEVASGST